MTAMNGMTMWDFAGAHPGTAMFLAAAAALAFVAPWRYAFAAWKMYLRSKNIAAHGWPKAPMDADGNVAWPQEGEKSSGEEGFSLEYKQRPRASVGGA